VSLILPHPLEILLVNLLRYNGISIIFPISVRLFRLFLEAVISSSVLTDYLMIFTHLSAVSYAHI